MKKTDVNTLLKAEISLISGGKVDKNVSELIEEILSAEFNERDKPFSKEEQDKITADLIALSDIVSKTEEYEDLRPSNLPKKIRKGTPSTKTDIESKRDQAFLKSWLKDWAGLYLSGCESPMPSERKGKESSRHDDYAVVKLLDACLPKVDQTGIEKMYECYRTVQQAQSKMGDLLEEYLSTILEPLGWIWCRGKCVYSTDFVSPAFKYILQVKNTTSTNNSGAGDNVKKVGENQDYAIVIWHRWDSGNNEYYWSYLLDMVKEVEESVSREEERPQRSIDESLFEEEAFLEFIETKGKANPDIVYQYTEC